jgi:GNAT superfamily N-acetyltransferase
VSDAAVCQGSEADWHKIALVYEADGYLGDAADIRLRAAKELEEFRAGDRALFLTEIDGRVVGTVGLAFRGMDAGYADGVVSTNVARLYVVQAQRRNGIATALMAAAEDEARRRGFQTVTIEVEDDNALARTLYDKLGYRHAGLVNDAGNVPMAKQFDQS